MTDQEQVKMAALYCDEAMPGWWLRVDPLTLNLNNSDLCICGQAGYDWEEHDRALALLGLGQDVLTDRELEPLWLEEIAARIPAPAHAPCG